MADPATTSTTPAPPTPAPATQAGTPHPALRAADVLSALDTMLAGETFHPSPRHRALIRYLVETTLAGDGPRLSEKAIALDVLGKSAAHFDSGADPIVRVEMTRLRNRLAGYYEREGRDGAIVFSVPKGSYVPAWKRAGTTAISLASDKAIAVLPFVNLTGDPAFEPFVDALTDEITDALVKVPGLKVVARTSAFQFKGKHQDIRTIGARLKVGFILEGSVQRDGQRLKIISQIDRAVDGFHVWSDICTTQQDQLFSTQAEIARHVMLTLMPALSEQGAADPEQRRPLNAEAWTVFVQAQYHARKIAPEEFRKAFELAERAVALDPAFGRGHALLGQLRFRAAQAWGANGIADPATVERSRSDLLRAIELDPSMGSPYAGLGRIALFHHFDWPVASTYYELGVAHAPGHAEPRLAHAGALMLRRRFDEARHHLQIAAELDPLSLLCRILFANLAVYEGSYMQAIARFDEVLSLEPRNVWASWPRCQAFLFAGDIERAARETSSLASQEPDYPHPRLLLAVLEVLKGNVAAGHAAIDAEGDAHSPARWPYLFATINAMADRPGTAFDWLGRALEQRDTNLTAIHVDPALATLRADARFATFLSRVPRLALTDEDRAAERRAASAGGHR